MDEMGHEEVHWVECVLCSTSDTWPESGRSARIFVYQICLVKLQPFSLLENSDLECRVCVSGEYTNLKVKDATNLYKSRCGKSEQEANINALHQFSFPTR